MASTAPATESGPSPIQPTTVSTEHSKKMLEGTKPAWTGGTSTIISQSQEENKDDEKPDEVQTEPKIDEPATMEPGEETTSSSKPPEVVEDEIDSALLSALRDPRERLSLLKLEQVLIDFLDKRPQDRYVDVGGPYNCIVVSPTLGHIGGGLEEARQLSSAGGNAAVPNPNYIRPQSTFQRLILHRLCDRFCMTREKSYVDEGFGYYIRVVKSPASRKPVRLLMTVVPSEYALTLHESISTGSLNANFEQMNVAGGAAGDNSAAIPPSGTPTATTKATKPRKMKIMKRSSNNSNASVNSSEDKKTSTKESAKRNSSLSEKERKYAEARNRILGTQETAEEHFAPISASSASETPSNKTNSSTEGGNSNAHSNASSRSSTPSHGNSNRTPPRTGSGGISQTDGGGGGNRKATYRNRQQEEADPDFRRGARMVQKPHGNAGHYYPNQHNAGRGYDGQHHKKAPQQRFQQQYQQQYPYGVHPQQHHPQQYHQQYFVAQQPTGQHSSTANVGVYPGIQAARGMYQQQAVQYGQGVSMVTGAANVGQPSSNPRTKTPVNVRREQSPAT